MPLVVLLRGVNVGGYKTFRPSLLAKELKHLDVINIGAAGTFVIRRPVTQARLRKEFARNLPFNTHIIICEGQEIVKLVSQDPFKGQRVQPDMVRFVSVLSQRPRLKSSLPLSFPPTGTWLLKIVTRENRFVIGLYRRHMKAIGYLGKIDGLFGVPATTRNWNTIIYIAKVVGGEEKRGSLA